MSDKRLIVLEDTKKIVEFNSSFEQLKENIIIQLKDNKYNSIVTIDNFDAMKETSQELGKMAKYVSNFRIAKVKEESVEIQNFEKNFKEITQIIEAKQETIKDGLSVFEEITRKQINLVCEDYLNIQIEALNIRLEFQNIDISDMTQRKFMTKTGAISTAGKNEVETRVNVKLALQNKIDLRISNLENICLRAGIEPLTIEHIQGFLFETDEKYEIKLKVLIDAEIKRSEAVKLRVEAETRKAVEEEKTPFDDCPPPQDSEIIKYAACGSYQEFEQPIKKEGPIITEDGKVEKILSIKIRVPQKATDEQIISAVIKMIKADTLPVENIEVR